MKRVLKMKNYSSMRNGLWLTVHNVDYTNGKVTFIDNKTGTLHKVRIKYNKTNRAYFFYNGHNIWLSECK